MGRAKIYSLDEFEDQKSKISKRILGLIHLNPITNIEVWNKINEFCSDGRDFVIKDDNQTFRLYITTGAGINDENSLLVTAKKGLVQVSSAKYYREGNGVNQLGVIQAAAIFDDGPSGETRISYMLSTKGHYDRWVLSYNFLDTNGPLSSTRGLGSYVGGKQSVVVDSRTLKLEDGSFASKPEGDKLIKESILLFRRANIKGVNSVDDDVKYYDYEDLRFLGIQNPRDEELARKQESAAATFRTEFPGADKRIASNDVASQEHPSPKKGNSSNLEYTLHIID